METVTLLEMYREDCSAKLKADETAEVLSFSDWKKANDL